MEQSGYAQSLSRHYGRKGLGLAIVEGLRAAGKDRSAIQRDDLAPIDHFHIRGKEATLELARLAGLRRGIKVLDVGGGLGGPARTLAGEIGCQVTVLDLTEEYCRVGEDLTRRTGLGDRVVFCHGSALEMPFPDQTFDAVWTEHSSMNIEQKERLYDEIRRVLRAGGRLAMYEIMGGPNAPIHFPVPWARDAASSFLRPPQAIRALLSGKHFEEVAWVDVSTPALEWFRKRVAAARAAVAPPPLGLHLLLGEDFAPMFRNQVRNLEEGRIAVIMGVWDRPSHPSTSSVPSRVRRPADPRPRPSSDGPAGSPPSS
ncbi:MAG: methyltransferase domain-containing protein [Candidatus Rokubacteria bacterium]|nr:methyltransferase domain-containing protein [Candidatus Rokubacteria bacterium]